MISKVSLPGRVAITAPTHKRLKMIAAAEEIPIYKLVELCVDAFVSRNLMKEAQVAETK